MWQAGTISVVGGTCPPQGLCPTPPDFSVSGFLRQGLTFFFPFLFYIRYYYYYCGYVFGVCALEHVSALALEGTLRRQKRASDLLMLDFQVVVSYTVWMLGTQLSSSGSVIRSLVN